MPVGLVVALAIGVFLVARPSTSSSSSWPWTSPVAILDVLRAEAGHEAHPARDHGRVHVRFVDAARRPLTGVSGHVELDGEISYPRPLAAAVAPERPVVNLAAGEGVFDRHRATISASGDALFEELSFGRWHVAARAEGFRPARAFVELSALAPRCELELVLVAQRTFDLALEQPDGEPVFGERGSTGADLADRLRIEVREVAPTLAGSDFVPFVATRREPTQRAYWRTLTVDSLAPVKVSIYLADVLVASGEAASGAERVTLVAALGSSSAARARDRK